MATTLLDGPFESTRGGHQGMWGVRALAMHAAVPVLARVRD